MTDRPFAPPWSVDDAAEVYSERDRLGCHEPAGCRLCAAGRCRVRNAVVQDRDCFACLLPSGPGGFPGELAAAADGPVSAVRA